MAETETFMILSNGIVQHTPAELNGAEVRVWPIAQTYDDARKLAKWFGDKNPGKKITCDRIGSKTGETLEGQIRASIELGCVAACCVAGWSDGAPIWKWLHFN